MKTDKIALTSPSVVKRIVSDACPQVPIFWQQHAAIEGGGSLLKSVCVLPPIEQNGACVCLGGVMAELY